MRPIAVFVLYAEIPDGLFVVPVIIKKVASPCA